MPWKETCTMDQRMLFIVDYLSGRYTKRGTLRNQPAHRPSDRYRIHGPEGTDDLLAKTRLPSRHDGTGDR